ncbi:MAG: 2-oxoglutarate ferredoxin oxidoreductase subunit alpha [Candidatus Marinimicrobia bacterium]|nr:2-oxoglutarate ferredoxin oxidoreductase subunit alpha [Candidatus Neomarinimicrobiota bacterium]|tara:strand:- start:7964 stop:9802 length:1839 start_codon:yes stop_codon:yes gene_type:complete
MSKNSSSSEVVTIRFSGDSGDGMQLTGGQFSDNTAIFGNDLNTLPDFPAEIRAPQGTLYGVSSFQMQFGSRNIYTAGDDLDVLVAMNPAALKVHVDDLKEHGLLIINTDNFTPKNLKLAKYEENPLDDSALDKKYRVIKVGMTSLVTEALKDLELTAKEKARSTNMFALGLLYWLYERDMQTTINFLNKKFKNKPLIIDGNVKALKTGFYYGETIEVVKTTYRVDRAKYESGEYRNIMGNQGIALGLLAASHCNDIGLFFGGYPITPASDILHMLSNYKSFGVKTFQAEDEIAGITSAIGAAFSGRLGVTASSGPGIALKGEAIGLAIITELPLVIINIQRGGPSTGLPTKTEQSDLFQAMYGRNGECPCVVVSATSPSDCFEMAYEASRIAVEHMIPVLLLSDGYIANGSEPWKYPDVKELPKFKFNYAVENSEDFNPYERNPETLARKWAIPGFKGLEHRIGGLEKADKTGNVSYDPDNHHLMTQKRQEKVDIIANFIPDATVLGKTSGKLLVIGWGGTFGSIKSAVVKAQEEGLSVSHLHLKYINPFPKNLGEIILNYDKILIPELNMGQLLTVIRAKYLVDAQGYNSIKGKPFSSNEIFEVIKKHLED